MAEKYTYRLAKVDAGPNDPGTPSQKTEVVFDAIQDDGWEYVSGPVVSYFAGGESRHEFLIRKPKSDDNEQDSSMT